MCGHLFSFLTKPKKEMELRKWAAEGLSYLTMDAEVKVLLRLAVSIVLIQLLVAMMMMMMMI